MHFAALDMGVEILKSFKNLTSVIATDAAVVEPFF